MGRSVIHEATAYEEQEFRGEWLPTQYGLARVALADLAFSEADGIPELEEVQDGLSPTAIGWLSERRAAGHQDELVIAPSMQEFGGIFSKPGETDLIDRWDLLQRPKAKKGVSGLDGRDLAWWRITPAELDNGRSESWQTAILLGDIAVGQDSEPGLLLTGKTTNQQRHQFGLEQQRLERQGLNLDPVTVSQVVLANARRRHAKLPLLGSTGAQTRLIQLPDAPHYGDFLAHTIGVDTYQFSGRNSTKDRLSLSAVSAGHRGGVNGEAIGVRRTLRIPTELED